MTHDPKHPEDAQALGEEELDEGNLEEDDLEDEDVEDEDLAEEPEEEREPERGRGPRRIPWGQPTRRAAQPGMGGPRRGAPPAATPRAKSRAIAVDPSLRIRDRVSEAFVIGTLLVFGAILVNALAFGHGGAFSATPTPIPTPIPTVYVTPAPTATVGPSASPAVSSSPVASPAPSPS